MEGKYLKSIKSSVADEYLLKKKEAKATDIHLKEVYSPIFSPVELHSENISGMNEINEAISDIARDLNIIDVEISSTAVFLDNMMKNTKTRLKQIKNNILIEQERQQDINILCNNYTDFSNVIRLTEKDFEGDFSYEDNMISSAILDTVEIAYSIKTIQGNGYEGNEFVYTGDKFMIDTIDSSIRSNINDNNLVTYYEYSRLTADSKEEYTFPELNLDSIEAICTIYIESETEISSLKIVSEFSYISLIDVKTSDDGVHFKRIVNTQRNFNTPQKKYETSNYIPGSGIVSFPLTRHIKITLQSNNSIHDKIAFIRTNIIDESLKEE